MIPADVQNVPLFKGLSRSEIEKFVNFTGTTFKNYPRGERILEAFAPNANLGIIVTGEAQILSLDWLGNETVGHVIDSGAIFGSVSAILGEDLIATSVRLTTDSTIMWIPYRSLLIAGPILGRTHGVVMKNLLEAFSRKNVLMMQKVELLSQKTLRERVILYLIQREKRQMSDWVKVPGRVQFAKELECNRSALTREIAQMQSKGLVEVDGRRMKLNKDNIT